jgi:nucleotide-binding universal stress UspA family protein
VPLWAAASDLKLPARLATQVEEAVGDPVETILGAAGRDDVLAFAMRHKGELGVGSVADGILARAQQTLLVMRPGMRPISSLRRIVVPLEGSPRSSGAMRLTEEAFCARGREIVVLHVSTADMPDEPGSLPAPRMVDQEQYEWSSWHEEFTMRFATCPEGGRHRTVVRVGDPAEAIVEEATTPPADLIVLAWAGVFKAGRSMFVRAVLEHAPCPLLLVTVSAQRLAVGASAA